MVRNSRPTKCWHTPFSGTLEISNSQGEAYIFHMISRASTYRLLDQVVHNLRMRNSISTNAAHVITIYTLKAASVHSGMFSGSTNAPEK